MTFDVLHKLVLYATVALGLMPLATSGEIPLPAVVGAYGAMIASWFYDPPRRRVEAHSRWWTLATLAAMVALGVMGWSTGYYLLYAILFALVMVVTRLFQSRSSRDVFQLYGLTFMAIVAGAVVNPALSFLFLFVPYIVLLVWGLVLLHLQRDVETLQEEQASVGERPADLMWKARDLVTGRFLAGTSVLAVVVFAFSLVIFFFFPRLGMGFFFKQGRSGQSVSGFADTVQLGHFGTIKQNLRVVMRVEIPGDEGSAGRRDLRMRGISFDTYDGIRWKKGGESGQFEVPRTDPGRWRIHDRVKPSKRLPSERLVQDVYLEPLDMGQRMIFGQPRMRLLSIPRPELDRLRKDSIRFYQDGAGDVSTRVSDEVALRYRVISQVVSRDAERLREAEGALPDGLPKLYLQTPDELDPAVEALARAVTADAETAYDKAAALERHLKSNYAYTTEGGHDPKRPLEDFLLERKSGHCEYFATAMALMLRTVDVPTRIVNGFYGGDYNAVGDYYAIRQADAHSWVEVLFPEYGWVTFDPTPANAVLVPGREGFVGMVEEWIDSLRLQWFKWVVEYDLDKQIAFFSAVGEAMGDLRDVFPRPEGNPKRAGSWKKGLEKWAKDPTTWALVATPIVLILLWRFGVLAALLSWLRGRLGRSGPTPGGRVGEAYARMLKVLGRQGIARRDEETPRELAARLRSSGYPAADAVVAVTEAFEAVRYAERDPGPEAVRAVERSVREIRRVRH
ncbi:MAG: transglutaminase TgpA family protein [Myxococcota bacterium]